MQEKHMEDLLELPLRSLLAVMQSRIMAQSRYFGIPTHKCPLDMWVYQEIIYQTKPDAIVELGVFAGGSTLALAHLCDMLGHGQVIGVDVVLDRVPEIVRSHPRVKLIHSDACAALPAVRERLTEPGLSRVMVVEDTDHSAANTLAVMQAYGPLVSPGCYLIVEDGICHHGLDLGPSPGPYEAILEFLKAHPEFVCDRSREAFLVTWNPAGFLRRLS